MAFTCEFFGYLVFKLEAGHTPALDGTFDLKTRGSQALIMFFRLLLSYLLMLIVMTYNVGLLIAACLGMSTAYLAFGFSTFTDNMQEVINNNDSELDPLNKTYSPRAP